MLALLVSAATVTQCQQGKLQDKQSDAKSYEISDEELPRRSARLQRESEELDRRAAHEIRPATIADIKTRCQRQMGSQGAGKLLGWYVGL